MHVHVHVLCIVWTSLVPKSLGTRLSLYLGVGNIGELN